MNNILVSGVQPTGNLHIGNYLGAVKNFIDLQEKGEHEMFIFVADLHSLTGNMTADERREQVFRTVAELLAAGINPKKMTFFVQSHLTQHAELAWIFNTVTPIAELERMTQFKDKSARQEKNINAGLLTYPILQAADILLYRASQVPVGQDQIQHIELTRDIARFFNKRYGNYFPETKPLLTPVPKVMSLLEPEKKMSKSLGTSHVIELADEPEVIEKKLKKAVTATEGGTTSQGVQNLLTMMKYLAPESLYKEYVQAEKTGSIRYGDLKQDLAHSLSETFTDYRQKRASFLGDKKGLWKIMEKGRRRAEVVAEETMREVRELVGLK